MIESKKYLSMRACFGTSFLTQKLAGTALNRGMRFTVLTPQERDKAKSKLIEIRDCINRDIKML